MTDQTEKLNRFEALCREQGMAEMLDRIHKFALRKARYGVFRPAYVGYADLLEFVKRELADLRAKR